MRILSTFVIYCSFIFRGGDSEAIEQIVSNVLYSVVRIQCEDMIKYIKNEINRKVFSSRLIFVVSCSRVAALPLKRLQSLRDRIPHGVIYIHTTCDYCFVIASMGVRKKRAEALFIYVCPWATPIGLIAVATQTPPKRCNLRLHYA